MVDEPISSSARYRFTASHPQVQHALTSDFRRAYNSSCTLFRDSFIIRNGTRGRSLADLEGCEGRVLDRQSIVRHLQPFLFSLLFRTFSKWISDWFEMKMNSFCDGVVLNLFQEIANAEFKDLNYV